MTIKMLKLAAVLGLFLTLGACSDDDEYTSRFPEIVDVEFSQFANGDSTLVTIKTGSKSQYVHRTKCTWEVTPALSTSLSYDSDAPGDAATPKCSFATPGKGAYEVVYTAKYGIDGKATPGVRSVSGNGWNATYTMSTIAGTIVVKATFRIL